MRAAKSENGHTEQLCCIFTSCRSEAAGWQRACAERSADPSDKAASGYLAVAMAVSLNRDESLDSSLDSRQSRQP